MCTMLAKEGVAYNTANNTQVCCVMLDATKVFDRVNYVRLYDILLKIKIPTSINRLLFNMYLNQKTRVSLNINLYICLDVSNGIKQGGILNPMRVCIYIDGLVTHFKKSDLVCYIGDTFWVH